MSPVAHIASLPVCTLLSAVAFGIAFQASEIAVFVLAGSILRIDVPTAAFFAIVPVVYFATLAPISLGGLGVREGVLTWMLSKLGVPASDAVLLAFLVYLNRVLVAALGGVVQLATRPSRHTS
jgi:hypothetical protein